MLEYYSRKEGTVEVPEIILEFLERTESDNPNVIRAIQSVRHSSLGVISANGKTPKLFKHLEHSGNLRAKEARALTRKLHLFCSEIHKSMERRIEEIKNPNRRSEFRKGCEPLLKKLSSKSNGLSLSETLKLIAEEFEFAFMPKKDRQQAICNGDIFRS